MSTARDRDLERIERKNKMIADAVASAPQPEYGYITEPNFLHYYADAFFGKADMSDVLYAAWINIAGTPQLPVNIVHPATGAVIITVPPLQNTLAVAPVDTRQSRTRAAGINDAVQKNIGVGTAWQTEQLVDQYNKSQPHTKQYVEDARQGWLKLLAHYGVALKRADLPTTAGVIDDEVDFSG